jgi:hypothetical protein
MTPLKREIEIIRLEERRSHMGMGNIAQLSSEDRLTAQAQYRLDVKEINNQIAVLRAG